ncbi:MAG: 23S rRNA (adenine(2503)-C(2))-methyltransferase RlmN [Bdellovibrionaceae bacterium]|nr:23S rRNA (adenine(2503)-C(2))-methyltransferase RlmN [Pseudobdellovibrionaceae bacterium]
MIPFYSLSYQDLRKMCDQADLAPATANHLFNWYYKKRKLDFCRAHNLSSKAKQYILSSFDFALPKIHFVQESTDKTVKFLMLLHDGATVETVLIPFQGKYTLCLSSQVGCAMNCSFCYTGAQGFKRHLYTEEIIGQFLRAQIWLTEQRPADDRILNIVFMGQGEPLHNFDAVKKASEIFISQNGLSLADHKITISTSGYLPGLLRWKEDMPNVNIALSLHAATNEKRAQLIPLNRRYPLETILPIVDAIPQGKKRFVTYEYLLTSGFNDSSEDAHALGKLLQHKKAYINLIPFNPYPGSQWKRPADLQILGFKQIVESYSIPTLVRTTKGAQILAACGQLNTSSRNMQTCSHLPAQIS